MSIANFRRCHLHCTAIAVSIAFAALHTSATAGWWEIDIELEVAELPDMLPEQWTGLELGDTVYYSTLLYATSPADNSLRGSATTQVFGVEYLTEHDPESGWYVGGYRSHFDFDDTDQIGIYSAYDHPDTAAFSVSYTSRLLFNTLDLPSDPPVFPGELPLDLLLSELSWLNAKEDEHTWIVSLSTTSWHATWIPSPATLPPLAAYWFFVPRRRRR